MAGEAFLPPEIIAEILSKLDVKCLLVLKCVCKLWCSIIEERHFIHMHLRRSKVTYVLPENLYGKDFFELLDWCDGLRLEKHKATKRLSIRNPATKTKFDLPEQAREPKVARFGYISATHTYKVFTVFGMEGDRFGGCHVLTLGTGRSEWRSLEIPSLQNLNGRRFRRYLIMFTHDVLYIMWLSGDAETVAPGIVCIDLKTESFETMTAPEAFFQSWDDIWPMDWGNKLSLSKTVGEELHVWVLEDYKTQKWADTKLIISLSFLNKHYTSNLNKFIPQYMRDGWLWFSVGIIYRISYHVETGEESIINGYVSPERNDLIGIKYSLLNPFGVPPVPPLDNKNSICLPFLGILDFFGGLCFFPK